MQKKNGCYYLFGNKISKSISKQADQWQVDFINHSHDLKPDKTYELSVFDDPNLKDILGIEVINEGNSLKTILKRGIIVATVRDSYRHFRTAIATASCAKALKYKPYWIDLKSIPGITTESISWYRKRIHLLPDFAKKSKLFSKYIWDPIYTGITKSRLIRIILENNILTWNRRHIKTNIKDYKMSELFQNIFKSLPVKIPICSTHMWCSMAADAAERNNFINIISDSWPISANLTEKGMHAIPSPSLYYEYRSMKNFGNIGQIMKEVPSDRLYFTGHFIDHEIVNNIEIDCKNRLKRSKKNEPKRFFISIENNNFSKASIKKIIKKFLPLIKENKATLLINPGDHGSCLETIKEELKENIKILNIHYSWNESKDFADNIEHQSLESGVHVFIFENIYHAVYATNYLMRFIDVLITKPNELSFFPVPKVIHNDKIEKNKLNSFRSTELGDSTPFCENNKHLFQAIDLFCNDTDLLKLYCDNIIKNKNIGIYDGAYNAIKILTKKR